DPLVALPPDLVIEIFRNLSVHDIAPCMLVSKTWYYSLDRWSVLWKTIDMREASQALPQAAAVSASRVAPKSEIMNARLVYDSHLKVLARRAGPALSKLSIFFAPLISDSGMAALLHFGCTNIRHLELRATNRISNLMFGSLVTKIGAHLEYLALSTTDISDFAVQNILLSSPKLTHLDLSYCRFVTCDAFPLADSTRIAFCHNSRDIAASVPNSLVREQALGLAHNRLPKLKTLLLSCCPDIDDRAVRRIASAFGPSLERLDLSRTKATILALGALATAGRAADQSNTGSCYGDTAQPVTAGTGVPFERRPRLHPLPLQQLSLSDVNFHMEAGVVEANASRDASLEARCMLFFAESAQNLTRLSLAGENDTVTDEFATALAQRCRGLEEIDIHDSLRIGDRSMAAFGAFCRRLRAVNISGCLGCSSLGVIELVRGCPEIVELDLSALRIGDEVLAAIGDSMRHLERLSLDLCGRITHAGIRAVVEGSNGLGCLFTLTELSFIQCRAVDESVVDWCKERLRPDAIIRC
ncbi:RNI-like protein, partial [Martensiomyces pterosporus]